MQKKENIYTNVNPLQTNGIRKLEMGNDEAEDLSRCRKCRILCGRESIMVTAMVLVIGGGQYFIFHLKGGFIFREGVWVFFALAVLSCSLVLSFMARICIAVQPKKENKQEDGNKDKKNSKIASALKPVIARWAKGLCEQQCSAVLSCSLVRPLRMR